MKRVCKRFRQALDRLDPGAFADPHPDDCLECAVELRAASVMRDLLAKRRESAAPAGFAARVAYLARAEAGERVRRARRTAWVPSPEAAWIVTGASMLAAGATALPVLRDEFDTVSRALAAGITLPAQAAAAALAVFSFTAAVAIVAARRAHAAR